MIYPTHTVQLHSEIGRLKTVMLHRPGPEIEAMIPSNISHALYSDLLSMPIAQAEYAPFEGTLKRVANVLYVKDMLSQALHNDTVREHLVSESCHMDNCPTLVPELLSLPCDTLAQVLIEGYPSHTPDPAKPYLLQPLYNLYFTRDACSYFANGVILNSMSFSVRRRETLIYKVIAEQVLHVPTYWAEQQSNSLARTEGGDIQIVKPNLLCVGNGIRTNKEGIEALMQHYGTQHERFVIIAQELPQSPESFIHLDMVFTFLGAHHCMAFKPLLDKRGLFAHMHTVKHVKEGNHTYQKEYPNILAALETEGIALQPIYCGMGDDWQADREQWHSGANFFAFGENHILGYRRNRHTIQALDQAGFAILDAAQVAAGAIDPWHYDKAVVTFAASELPRGGGGARCMTCPICRDETNWD